ncbi:hypothetical protein ACH4SP_21465 [Streptomyces sp. NPDC021093]|uniref:hypothetical protein n=1 Tax=Streptomyces sp. NPDC021093 TaxID=3365112 RepID=UPI0037A70A40
MHGSPPFSSPYDHERPHGHQGPHGPQAHHGHRLPPDIPAAPECASAGAAGDLVRWAAFSCLLVPVVLIGYGAPVGGATLAAGGLAVVTVACRMLLHQSARAAARDRELAEDLQAGTHRGRHSRTGSGTHRGGRKADS